MNPSTSSLDSLAVRVFENVQKVRSEQGDLPILEHENKSVMKRRLSLAVDLYSGELPEFIEKNFEILPEKNKTRLGFPTRLFSHLFSYRFMQDSEPSNFYQLGEKRPSDPRLSLNKHTDNSAFVIHAMKNLYPDLQMVQVNCPHSMNPKAKKKVNPYTQIRCFDRLYPKKDSAFLNEEILSIANNPNHFLNPLVESWLMKKVLVEGISNPENLKNLENQSEQGDQETETTS